VERGNEKRVRKKSKKKNLQDLEGVLLEEGVGQISVTQPRVQSDPQRLAGERQAVPLF